MIEFIVLILSLCCVFLTVSSREALERFESLETEIKKLKSRVNELER